MSQVWVPWQENPNRYRLVGWKRLWAPLLAIYRLFRRIPGALFWGGVVAASIIVWLHALLFGFLQTRFLENPQVNAAEVSRFGGELTLRELAYGLEQQDWPRWLAYPLYPLGHEFVRDLIAMGGIIAFISVIPLFSIWWERKVSAHIQNRLGPMRVGGWHGWTQSLADGVKLVAKEDLIPAYGDPPLFRLAPYLAFVPSILAFAALPFGTYWVFRHTDVGLLVVLAMLGIEVVGVIIAGWASNNKWSVYGAMREACQMVSYEIPMGMALLLPIMVAGTLNLSAIGEMQSGGWFSWFCFANPFMLAAALAYYVASLASCKRAPFDLAESESELVAGFHTEYSGFRWSMFFFAEYCAMFVVSGLAVILFLGGWHLPWPAAAVESFVVDGLKVHNEVLRSGLLGVLAGGPLWFILKCALLIYIQMWVRWTLPRVRIDQLLYACVQVLLPLMMLLLLGNTFWIVLVRPGSGVDLGTRIVLGLLGMLLVLSFLIVIGKGIAGRRRLVGYLAIDALPGS